MYLGLCFGPNCLFNQVTLTKLVLAFFLHLKFNLRTEFFVEVLAKKNFWRSTIRIKLLEDWLKVFKVSCLILNFFLWVLRVCFDLILNIIYKYTGLLKAFPQKGYKSSKVRGVALSLMSLALYYCQQKKILSIKKKAANSTCLWILACAISK